MMIIMRIRPREEVGGVRRLSAMVVLMVTVLFRALFQIIWLEFHKTQCHQGGIVICTDLMEWIICFWHMEQSKHLIPILVRIH